MNSIRYKTKNILKLLGFVSCLTLLYACDLLEQDVTPKDPQVNITGTEIYTLSNGAAYIDLYSMVKTEGIVRLDIASLPRKGNLTALSEGFLQYSPNQGFTKGRDTFYFSIFSEDDRLLKKDSIVIIVENDSTNLPCGIYPQNDSIYGAVTGPITIDVLHNDILCGDTLNMRVVVYRPNEGFPPYYGTAVVLENNSIRYTPGNAFTGSDKIVYKVYNTTDSSIIGFGMVYITPEKPCEFELVNDAFVFETDTLRSDTLMLDVFKNDVLCTNSGDSLDIVGYPHYGTTFLQTDGINYVRRDTLAGLTLTDSLIYRICRGQKCATAKVQININ